MPDASRPNNAIHAAYRLSIYTTIASGDRVERADGKGLPTRRRKIFREKYNRSAMENAHELQCKALRGRGKSRRRRNNGKQ